jgi:Recombination endonuclease VII.
MTTAPNRRTDYGHQTRPDLPCQHLGPYHLTCDEYEALRDRAQDRCEICRTHGHDTPRGSLVIDHFQSDDLFFVRGLLCDRCNAVMARHDRKRVWGPATRPWAAKAAVYHRNSWGATPQQLALADQHIASRIPWTRRPGGYDPAFHDTAPV